MSAPTAPLQVDTFLPYMRDVLRCEESLRELNLTWRMIEASAKINCPSEARSILPMMSATRQGFEQLEKDLVESLVGERVAHILDEVGTKASHVVNIIVRNLYERTADVGFLATDRELCDYVAGVTCDRDQITQRLRAYRDKYTVYDDILLLDTEGNVMAHIDRDARLEGSRDPLLAETLAARGYVETFRASDLRPGKRRALLYSQRMVGSNGRVVGVLCLSFDFEREMADIFRSRRDNEARALMLLLDGENRVIASADEQWVPLGIEVPVHHGDDARLVMHSGREYLVRTYRADGYQGYPGPSGWQGSVMIPVDVAFTGRRTSTLNTLDPSVAAGLLTHARHFCPPLFQIITAAQSIRRVVWNGQVMTASQRRDLHKLKSILEQISDTGARTNALFSTSIRDLYDTVLGSTQRRGEFTARLLVDLLDRNLYERSDDCRWWALTPQLRQILADGTASRDRAVLDGVLRDIHRLYTVYTRLVVYDTQGRIIAGTALERADGSTLLGESIPEADLAAVLLLPNPQAYHVSPFGGSALSDGSPTYVYHAAIRAPGEGGRVVGGIGIIFDAATELRAMLNGGLFGHQQASAVFVDRSGRVVAATDDSRAVGTTLTLPEDMLAVPAGQSLARILVHRGQYMVVACAANAGYREFKTTDGYEDDVVAVVFDPLGAEQLGRQQSEDSAMLVIETSHDAGDTEEYATFFIDGQLYAVPAAQVLQASPATEIVGVSLDRPATRLGTVLLRSNEQAEQYVWVYDLASIVSGHQTATLTDQQVIVVQHHGRPLGLLVDTLHGVPEFPVRDISEFPYERRHGLINRLIRANRGTLLVPVLDLDALWTKLGQIEVQAA